MNSFKTKKYIYLSLSCLSDLPNCHQGQQGGYTALLREPQQTKAWPTFLPSTAAAGFGRAQPRRRGTCVQLLPGWFHPRLPVCHPYTGVSRSTTSSPSLILCQTATKTNTVC